MQKPCCPPRPAGSGLRLCPCLAAGPELAGTAGAREEPQGAARGKRSRLVPPPGYAGPSGSAALGAPPRAETDLGVIISRQKLVK